MSDTASDFASSTGGLEGEAMGHIEGYEESSSEETLSRSLNTSRRRPIPKKPPARKKTQSPSHVRATRQELEFRETYSVPENVRINFPKDPETPYDTTPLQGQSTIVFWPLSHFKAGLRFPLPTIIHQFLHYTQIHPVHVHPNIIRLLLGVAILNRRYDVELELEDVLFMYSLKLHPKRERYFLSSDTRSLQLVLELPNSSKTDPRGNIVVTGKWGSASDPSTVLYPINFSPANPENSGHGRQVEWVSESSLKKLINALTIPPEERDFQRLLTPDGLADLLAHPSHFFEQNIPRRQTSSHGYNPSIHRTISCLPDYFQIKKQESAARIAEKTERERKRAAGKLRKTRARRQLPQDSTRDTRDTVDYLLSSSSRTPIPVVDLEAQSSTPSTSMDKYTIAPSKVGLSFRPKKGKRPVSTSDTEHLLPPKRPSRQPESRASLAGTGALVRTDAGQQPHDTCVQVGSEGTLEEMLANLNLFSESDIPPLGQSELPALPQGVSDRCVAALNTLRSLSTDDLAPLMCVASVDMGRRYQLMKKKLADHSVLRDLAQKACLKSQDLSRLPELEKKLSETEENLKSALLELDHLKEKEATYERLRVDMDTVKKNLADMAERLASSELDKENALLELKARYTKQMEQEIQEAFNLGYTQAIEKYKIPISDAEDDDEVEVVSGNPSSSTQDPAPKETTPQEPSSP